MMKAKRKVYIKGEKYKFSAHMYSTRIVICTKTTCNYSSDCFKGVDILTGDYRTTWSTNDFNKYIEE